MVLNEGHEHKTDCGARHTMLRKGAKGMREWALGNVQKVADIPTYLDFCRHPSHGNKMRGMENADSGRQDTG